MRLPLSPKLRTIAQRIGCRHTNLLVLHRNFRGRRECLCRCVILNHRHLYRRFVHPAVGKGW